MVMVREEQRSSAEQLEADSCEAIVVIVRTWFSRAARDVENDGICWSLIDMSMSSSSSSSSPSPKSCSPFISISLAFMFSGRPDTLSADRPGTGKFWPRNGFMEFGNVGNAPGDGKSLISAAWICSGVRSVGSPVCSRICCCRTRAFVNFLWHTGH